MQKISGSKLDSKDHCHYCGFLILSGHFVKIQRCCHTLYHISSLHLLSCSSFRLLLCDAVCPVGEQQRNVLREDSETLSYCDLSLSCIKNNISICLFLVLQRCRTYVVDLRRTKPIMTRSFNVSVFLRFVLHQTVGSVVCSRKLEVPFCFPYSM